MDITCQKCGEPYDSYGITYGKGEGDMSLAEAKSFLAGTGCPCCHFGKHCTACHGTGNEADPACTSCHDGYQIVRRLKGETQWQYGYNPNVKDWNGPDPYYMYQPYECRDGYVENGIVGCTECRKAPCPVCNGSGKLVTDDDTAFRGLVSACDASDDPDSILLQGM